VGVKTVNVMTADEMKEATLSAFRGCDIAILAAAVADFTPETTSETKMKRGGGDLVIRLKPTEDIAALLGGMKSAGQFLAGFALETDDELANAVGKLRRKNLDIIILNSLKDEGAGFGHGTNRVTIIDRNNNIDKFELKTKGEVASDILQKIVSLLQ
ncbi:MAG: phosphopantothenoylcysteine decarboxylase, partial [Bacteroidales bacterium]|nr:phosphopantothenoylcysteine decarboxylase [Bacteroidales bacterium]